MTWISSNWLLVLSRILYLSLGDLSRLVLVSVRNRRAICQYCLIAINWIIMSVCWVYEISLCKYIILSFVKVLRVKLIFFIICRCSQSLSYNRLLLINKSRISLVYLWREILCKIIKYRRSIHSFLLPQVTYSIIYSLPLSILWIISNRIRRLVSSQTSHRWIAKSILIGICSNRCVYYLIILNILFLLIWDILLSFKFFLRDNSTRLIWYFLLLWSESSWR